MALVMVLTTILTNVCVMRLNKNYVNAATLTLDEKPVNPGDTAKSPIRIGNYFDGETFTSKNTLANGTVTSRFYRLKLGTATGFADAYCGNISMGATSDKKYTAVRVKVGTAMSIKNGNSTKSFTIDAITYNIIRAVCISNGEYAGRGNVDDIRYTVGQITIWRALYLCSEGQSTYDYSTFYSTGSSGDMSNIVGLIVKDIGETADTQKKMAAMISDYLSAAKDGTYADGDLLIWDDGITTDQKLFSAENVPTEEEHGQIAMTKVVKLSNGSTERRAGAVYGVYTNQACTVKVGEIGPTPDNGYALSNVLTTWTEEKNYIKFYIKEMTAPIGSELSTAVYGPITIMEDGGIDRTYTMDNGNPIIDESNPANVYVYKISTANKSNAITAAESVSVDVNNISTSMLNAWKQYGITGAEYTIYHWSESFGKFVSKGKITEQTSNKRYYAELEYTTDNQGLFFIKETKAPASFELDESETSGFFIQIHESKTSVETKRWTKAQGGDGITYKLYYRKSGGSVEHAFYNDPEGSIRRKITLEKNGIKPDDGKIADATFIVQQYKDGKFSNYDRMKYNSVNKNYYVDNVEPGYKYRVLEQKPGWGYYITPNREGLEFPVVVAAFDMEDEDVVITQPITNTDVLGTINLQKINSETGTYSNSEGTKIADSRFSLYAAENIYRPNGTQIIYAKDALVGQANRSLTATGTLTWEGLPIGKYYIKETVTGEGFVVDNESIPCNLDDEYEKQYSKGLYQSTTVSVTVQRRNTPKKGMVVLDKKDATTGLIVPDGTFVVQWQNKSNAWSDYCTMTFNASVQKYVSEELHWKTNANGNFRVVERKPGYGFYAAKDEVVGTFILSEANQYIRLSATNPEVLGVININKINKDTGKYDSQGDADITESRFTLKAAEDIYRPNSNTIIYKKDTEISTKELDNKGHASWSGLVIGKYYIEESTTGTGFEENKEIYECDLKSEYTRLYNAGSTAVPTVSINKIVENTPIKCPFAIQKIKGVEKDNDEEEYLAEAGFMAYLKSELLINEDDKYDFQNSTPVIIGENGETELFTDENGYLESIALPYGTYVIVESTVPHNYKAVEPFEVVIDESGEEPKEVIKLIDEEFRAKLKIIKKDSVSERPVLRANTEFKIKNKDTDEYISQEGMTVFKTDKTGTIDLKYPLRPGTYVIEEQLAPYGYAVNTEYITITVDISDYENFDEENMTVEIVIEYFDAPVTGKIVLEKSGEVLTGYQEGQFIYASKGLSNAIYELHAAENIYSIDNQVDEAGERYVHYTKDELIATLTTDAEGLALSDNLPMGRYYLIETKAPEGFTLNSTPIDVEIEYGGQTVPVVEVKVPVIDARQKIELTLTKQDKNNTELLLPGATYGLFAGEDIKDINGNVIVKTDEFIESATTGEDGKAVFNTDVPLGIYYFKELDAPEGFLISDEKIYIDAKYAGEDVTTINADMVATDYPTLTYVSKTDITGDVEIPGAGLQVINADTEELMYEWVSDGKEHVIEGLPSGKYILRETIAPNGYEIARDVKFEVSEEPDADGKPQVTRVQMKDDYEYGHLAIIKNDMSGEIFLPNAVYEVRDIDDNVIDTLKTNKKGYAKSTVDYLIGTYNEKGVFESYKTYYLVEVEAPKGYELDDTPVEFNFSKERDMVLKVKDMKSTPLPDTGDSNNYARLALLMAISFVVIEILMWRRKRGKCDGR